MFACMHVTVCMYKRMMCRCTCTYIISQVQARQAQLAAARLAEAHSNLTFKPQVSERSQRIAQTLGTDFLTRQQNHLAKRGKVHVTAD